MCAVGSIPSRGASLLKPRIPRSGLAPSRAAATPPSRRRCRPTLEPQRSDVDHDVRGRATDFTCSRARSRAARVRDADRTTCRCGRLRRPNYFKRDRTPYEIHVDTTDAGEDVTFQSASTTAARARLAIGRAAQRRDPRMTHPAVVGANATTMNVTRHSRRRRPRRPSPGTRARSHESAAAPPSASRRTNRMKTIPTTPATRAALYLNSTAAPHGKVFVGHARTVRGESWRISTSSKSPRRRAPRRAAAFVRPTRTATRTRPRRQERHDASDRGAEACLTAGANRVGGWTTASLRQGHSCAHSDQRLPDLGDCRRSLDPGSRSACRRERGRIAARQGQVQQLEPRTTPTSRYVRTAVPG